jgi:hypothetical protein
MKCEVQLYVAGTVFYETVIARDYKEAKEVALARNPKAKVIAVTAMFQQQCQCDSRQLYAKLYDAWETLVFDHAN